MLPAVLHQPGRRHADDRARLPGGRHAHRVLRRRRSTSCRCWPRTTSCPTSTASRRTSWPRRSCWCSELSRTARPARRPPREFYEQVDRLRPAATRSSSCRTRPTSMLIVRPRSRSASSPVPGAKDVGVEVHSLSKGFDMIGWRMGWVCGHERIVRAFADVKDNCDSRPVHRHPEGGRRGARRPEIPRRDPREVPAAAGEAGRHAQPLRLRVRDAGRHVLPLHARRRRDSTAGPTFENAEAASQYLITEQSICTVPWDDAGPFLRFSRHLRGRDEAAEDALMAETAARLTELAPVF